VSGREARHSASPQKKKSAARGCRSEEAAERATGMPQRGLLPAFDSRLRTQDSRLFFDRVGPGPPGACPLCLSAAHLLQRRLKRLPGIDEAHLGSSGGQVVVYGAPDAPRDKADREYDHRQHRSEEPRSHPVSVRRVHLRLRVYWIARVQGWRIRALSASSRSMDRPRQIARRGSFFDRVGPGPALPARTVGRPDPRGSKLNRRRPPCHRSRTPGTPLREQAQRASSHRRRMFP